LAEIAHRTDDEQTIFRADFVFQSDFLSVFIRVHPWLKTGEFHSHFRDITAVLRANL
jgi:hypothetical protein